MTIGRTSHPYQEEVVPEGKRLRMKDWLKSRIGDPRYPGLVWLDEEKQLFRIPWKHAALHGWDQNSDGALFRDWAEHTGACIRKAHPKQLKATFRCALHSLPDVHEERNQAKKRGDDACRVYRFESTSSSSPRRRHIRIRNHKERARKQNALKREQERYIQQNAPLPQSMSPEYSSSWNSSVPQAMFQLPTNAANNSHQYRSSDMEFSHQHLGAQRSWTTQSDPNLPHALLPTQEKASISSMENTFPNVSPFGSMQHSVSVPEISPPCFHKPTVYENQVSPAQEMSAYHGEELFSPTNDNATSFFHNPAMVSASPAFSSYSPPYCEANSPALPSSNSTVTYMNCVSQSTCLDHNSAQGNVSTSGAVNNVQHGNQFSSAAQNQSASPYFDEKLVGLWDALAASGAAQFTVGVSDEPPQSYVMTCTQARLPSSEDYVSTQTPLRGTSDQFCLMEQSLPGQMLGNVSPQSFVSAPGDYVESLSPPCQYGTGAPTESAVAEWIPSPQHESLLPAACTLLTTSSSPTTKKSPLKWISSDEQNRPSQSPNTYVFPQYSIQEMPFKDSETFGRPLAEPSDLNSPPFGGF